MHRWAIGYRGKDALAPVHEIQRVGCIVISAWPMMAYCGVEIGFVPDLNGPDRSFGHILHKHFCLAGCQFNDV